MNLLGACRVCLCSNPRKDITQLKSVENEECGYAEMILFCLNIQVHEESKDTKICTKCFKKIIDFHNFKSLALKNDLYLQSLNSQLIKDEDFSADDIKEEESNIESNEIFVYEVKEECIQNDNLLENEEPVNAVETIVYEYVKDTKKLKPQKKKATPKEPKNRKKREKKSINMYLQEPGICPVCGKTVKNLQDHSRIHMPTELRPKYACGLCDKVYYTFSGRHQHIRVKHKDSKKQCQICNAKVVHLKAHMRSVHDPNSRRIECPLCDRKFLSQSCVRTHVAQLHTGERPFSCDTCDLKFKTNLMLRRHTRRIHQREKKYQCDHCLKSFFLKERLVVHVRLHTNDRPYKCPDCDKRFVSADSLKGHRYTHNSGDLQCTQCDKTFSKPAYLRVHLLSHTKEKRYQCQYCPAAFHRSDHRHRHEYNSHVKLGKV